jgi:glutathione S-transferase
MLEELGLPYQGEFVDETELKAPKFESVNPNGRVPAIYDPNTDITLWESGAIITYLVDQYDKEKKLTYDSLKEKYQLLQWQHFQASGKQHSLYSNSLRSHWNRSGPILWPSRLVPTIPP